MAKNFWKETDYRLVDLVESKPLLWDCTSDVYKRTDLKIGAWDEIAKQLGQNFTGVMVSNRFKNIKDTFFRNLRNMKDSKRSGCGTESIFKPKWHMFDRLMFLKKACVQGSSISNIPSLTSEATATSYCEVKQEDDCTSNNLTNLNICYDEASQKFAIISDKVDAAVESNCMSQQSSSSYSEFEVTTISETPPTKSASAPASASCSTTIQASNEVKNLVTAKKRPPEDSMFCKRGVKSKKSSTLMEEAVDALKQFCSSDLPSTPFSQAENSSGTAHTLALFVETRLRSLPLDTRKECENEILKVLTKY